MVGLFGFPTSPPFGLPSHSVRSEGAGLTRAALGGLKWAFCVFRTGVGSRWLVYLGSWLRGPSGFPHIQPVLTGPALQGILPWAA